MPKRKSTIKQRKSKSLIPKDLSKSLNSFQIKGWLNDLAHSGAKEALEKISDYIDKEEDEDLREYAKIAYEECQYFYYFSDNEKDERDFLLAKMIQKEEDRVIDLEGKADAVKLELDKLDLDRKVHKNMMRNKNLKQREDWKYNFSEDFYLMVKNRFYEIEDEINYKSEWIEQARKMITSKKYLNVPADIFEHIHWDSEGIDFWEDEYPEDDKNNKPADEEFPSDIDGEEPPF